MYNEFAKNITKESDHVEFLDSTVDIGSYAFYDAGDDMAVTLNNCEINMDDNAFQSCGMVSLAINGSDTVLGKEAFAYCEDLTDVVFGANNVEVGSYAFYDCPDELAILYKGVKYNKQSIEEA